jgi:hypothetical protein
MVGSWIHSMAVICVSVSKVYIETKSIQEYFSVTIDQKYLSYGGSGHVGDKLDFGDERVEESGRHRQVDAALFIGDGAEARAGASLGRGVSSADSQPRICSKSPCLAAGADFACRPTEWPRSPWNLPRAALRRAGSTASAIRRAGSRVLRTDAVQEDVFASRRAHYVQCGESAGHVHESGGRLQSQRRLPL